MEWWQALVLGVVQGLSEFLPISSSGHLVLLPAALGWTASPLAFDTTVHLGTLLALLVIFWRDLLGILADWWQALRRGRPLETSGARLGWWILLGTIPGILAGLLLEDSIETLLGYPRAAGIMLLVTALLLTLGEVLGQQQRDLSQLTWLDSMLIGIAQAAAIVPGLSRSGATISTGLLRGLTRPAAARFSFLLSIPIVAGAGLLQLLKFLLDKEPPLTALPLLVGFLAAAACGYAAIRFLLAYLRRRPLYPFAIYCTIVGVLAIVLS